jgi:hypothetical protein
MSLGHWLAEVIQWRLIHTYPKLILRKLQTIELMVLYV